MKGKVTLSKNALILQYSFKLKDTASFVCFYLKSENIFFSYPRSNIMKYCPKLEPFVTFVELLALLYYAMPLCSCCLVSPKYKAKQDMSVLGSKRKNKANLRLPLIQAFLWFQCLICLKISSITSSSLTFNHLFFTYACSASVIPTLTMFVREKGGPVVVGTCRFTSKQNGITDFSVDDKPIGLIDRWHRVNP